MSIPCTLTTPCSQLYVYDRTDTHVVVACWSAGHHFLVGEPPSRPHRELALPGCPIKKDPERDQDWPSMRELRTYRVPGETVKGRKLSAHQQVAAGAFKRNQLPRRKNA